MIIQSNIFSLSDISYKGITLTAAKHLVTACNLSYAQWYMLDYGLLGFEEM